MHTFLCKILLSKHLCKLFGTVVTEVDEDNNVAFLNRSVNSRVINSLNKLVGYTFSIAFFHSLYHVGSLLSFTLYKQIVSLFHSIPTLVTVHSIEASYNTCNACTIIFTYLFNVSNETFATLRVGITSVHETVYEDILQAILLTYLDKLIHMVHR